MKVELAFLPQTCIGDGACVLACRKDAVKAPGVIARNLCIYCGECTKVCYAEALSLIGEWIDPEEACDRLLRDFVFFQRSGGVTISGGEPFFQAKFVKELLDRLHSKAIHTAVETCGYAKREDMLEAKVDQFLFDIKIIDETEHIRWTGCSNKIILDNLDALYQAGRRITLRFPLLPEINDSEENLKATADLVRRYGLKELHVLPFHQLGSNKYQMIQKEYLLKKKAIPTNEYLRKVVQRLVENGIHPVIGG